VSHDTDLCTAMAYLADLDAELEERGAAPGLAAHAAAREDLLYQLDCGRQLVAGLERKAAGAACTGCRTGCEGPADLAALAGWCRRLEARIAQICGEAAARAAA